MLSRRRFIVGSALATVAAVPLASRLLTVSRGGGSFLPLTGPYRTGYTDRLLTQLHCHTTGSWDGSISPAAMVAHYLGAGYDVLALTDHDAVTAQPDGIATKITANELSPSQQHIISINSGYTRGAVTDAQEIIDGLRAAGGEAHIAHPAWSVGMTYAELAALTGYFGLEIHNGLVVSGHGEDPVALPGYAITLWDQLLAGGRRDLWGVAVDDLHLVGAYSTFDMGRVHAFAASPAVADVVSALASGNFVADVANHGVTPGYPERNGSHITVTCPGATKVLAYGTSGLLATTAGTSIDYSYVGDESYVRLVAVGDYTEPFSAALSDRWHVVDGTWNVAGGILSLTSDTTQRRVILRRHREGDIAAQVDVRLSGTGSDGAALMFHVLNDTHYYMVRIGESAVSGYNNQLAVAKTTNNAFAADSQLANAAFDPTANTWYTLKLDYTSSTGRIRAKVWERGTAEPDWQVDVSDTTWKHGAFGFRANRSTDFDNLYIDGFRTYYQPVIVGA